MFTPVSPVPASAPVGGLRRSAQEIRDGERWEDGFAWKPERCPVADTFDPCAHNVGEVQTVTITGAPTGGDFTLTWNAQTTAAIPWNAAAAAVLAALVALSNIGPGDVTVSGGPGPATPYVVTFSPLLGNVATMTANGAGLTGGTTPAVGVVVTSPGSLVYGDLHGDGGDDIAYYRPVGFRVLRECSTLGGRVQVDEESVRKQADAITSYEMARELWTGNRTTANPYDLPDVADTSNAYLASTAATTIAGGYTPLDGLGELEETARGGNLGLDVTLHVPIQLVPALATALVKEGNTLRTLTGAQVIADAGYDGSAPDGTLEDGRRWMYATGPVAFRLSEIVTLETIDHNRNRRVVTAERLFAAYFDPCNHYGLAVVIPTPAEDPA